MTLTLGFVIVILLSLLVVWKAGRTYPILYLFLFIYFLQYIFAPFLAYTEYPALGKQMPISQEEYLGYVIPAILCLSAGVLLFTKNIDIRRSFSRIDPAKAARYGYVLIVISFVFDFVSFIGFSYLNSIISFTTYLKYLGAFCMLFSNARWRFIVIGGIYLLLGTSVLSSGVFISFLMWSAFLFFFVTLRYNFSFLLRAGFIVLCLPVVFMIQSVKHEYRRMTWKGQQEGSMELLTDLAKKQTQLDQELELAKTSGVVRTVARLNQGWHLGMTLRHVPAQQSFADGKEMLNDVVASVMPRVLFPGKKEVNSQEKFHKYTGHLLTGSTSMSIGVLGDFYINFGREGSFIMLFVFGALMAILVNVFIKRYVLSNPINLIWIPFILSYLIRANNDFYIFFNCMLKGFIIFLIIDYYRYSVLKLRTTRRRFVPRPVTS